MINVKDLIVKCTLVSILLIAADLNDVRTKAFVCE
jgi:hypothetical protein